MSYNFINNALSVNISQDCEYDSSIGYEADFSENGNVDGWDQFSGMHTYGVWGGFLFSTLYQSSGYIGRQYTFIPIPAETHYYLKISMKINPIENSLPTTARVKWKTIGYPSWSSDKTKDFPIYSDNIWHTYILNMGSEQWWQGDINQLRIYPMTDGADGDEFFIKSIKITSISTFNCNNPTCSYYNNYSHPCAGIGSRGYCLASSKDSNFFTIKDGVNDELTVNINEYGSEVVTLSSGTNLTGDEVAKDLTKNISQVDIGGYAETQVTYSEEGKFKIYSGTYTTDSSVEVENSSAAETLGFFSGGNNASTKVLGTNPAIGFKPKSSFKIKSFQLLELFDSSEESSVEFKPFLYSVEGGRSDWAENGLGSAHTITQPDVNDGIGKVIYDVIENENKTIIDFNHPFNASGKIKKLYAIGSVVDEDGNVRTGCKLKIFRKRKNGKFKTIHTINIPNRVSGKLYSKTQEYVAIDCDLWVNKGDLLGAYNIDVYVGKSYTEESDALYFQISSQPAGEFSVGDLKGDGNAGLFFYARGDDVQKKLLIDIDLGKRVNIKDITVKGTSDSNILEYNIARCLDINWQVDFFGGIHRTGYYKIPGYPDSGWNYFTHNNLAYGVNNLTDGIYGNENGLAADSFTHSETAGVIPTNPNYFWSNGDEEWVGIHFHIPDSLISDPVVLDFENDPIAFSLIFPSNRSKKIFKSVVYFKERMNFRNFALSAYIGPDAFQGDADDSKFMLIEYTAITVDNLRYYDGMEFYDNIKDYIFKNPCNAKPIVVNDEVTNYDEFMAAEIIDWNVIEHEFALTECKGFRLYTDYHKSTKINEMELYSYVENEGTNIADSVSMLYSQYEDLWLNADLVSDDENAVAFIGDTPQYFTVEIEPVSTIQLSDIIFNVDIEDVFVGEKGCKYQVLLDHSKTNATNQPNRIDLKNVYGKPYDLYVDIPKDADYEKGLVFWSKMNDEESITKPEVGPGAYYNKKEDYPLVLREKNCAINCPVYGLKNLIDGKDAYYAVDEVEWVYHSTLSSGIAIDFSNIQAGRRTVINVPLISRNRWWKFGFLDPAQTAKIREAKVFYNNNEYSCTFYYDDGLSFADGPVSGPAPHLNNDSFTGSYYTLANNKYIGFDLGSMKAVDKIILYHDHITYASCTLSIYASENNVVYGKYCDLDLKDGSHTFSAYYYSYFAVDLGRRYNLQIVRNYGGSDLLDLSSAYTRINDQGMVHTAFDTLNGDPKNLSDTNTSSYWQSTDTATNWWKVDLGNENSQSAVRLQLQALSGDPNRAAKSFKLFGSTNDVDWDELLDSGMSYDTNLQTFTIPVASSYRYYRINIYSVWANNLICLVTAHLFKLTGDISYSSDEDEDVENVVFDDDRYDARWVRFRLLNGDGTDRYIRKLGIYPTLTNYMAPSGGYNHEWNSLGSSITNYTVGKNVALGTVVNGSSNFGQLYLGKITDGIIGDTLTEAWGSNTSSTQWVEIDLGLVYNIYRVKIYHGYDDEDTNYMIEDYTIQTSLDASSYNTIFTITGNSDFERIHELSSPVQTRYIKMNITSYSSSIFYLPTGVGNRYDYFNGAVLREIEVIEYYGFSVISSEEYPIIAINLDDQFPIQGHSLVGIDVEDTSTDWSNANSNFCYSDSVLSEPKKISFSGWGSAPNAYDQWVVIKRNTATELGGGPDYLKHAKIEAEIEPNPCEYFWWWSSSISELSNDHMNVKNSARSLKIEYPTGSGIENVYLIEGDTFETDQDATWRDAFNFWWYIDNVNNIDSDYGYIYFGNSNRADPVEYRWFLSSLVPYLNSGWNNLFLRFKSADKISYIVPNDINAISPRIISNLELKTIGLKFRSKGNAITMNIDSFKIERNVFMDYSKFSQGFYLAEDDYLGCPIGNFSLSKGTIEFWLRPDYNSIGVDDFNRFKYRSLFHFTNVENDVFGSVIALDGLSIYYGNIGREISILNMEVPYWEIDDLFHLAFVFSNDGSNIDIDKSTIRLYFNGLLAGKTTETWSIGDTKKFKFFLGGKNIHAVKEAFDSSSVDGVISNFKIYNYCKTNFDDSLGNYEVVHKNIVQPNNFIQISKDNLTFYSIGDVNLPLRYEGVIPDQTVYAYVRSCLPDGLDGNEARQASISASWFISV